jgi:hypothetical protein
MENFVFSEIKINEKNKMNTKNVLVSLLTIVSALFLVATVSAAAVTSDATIKVDGTDVATYNGTVVPIETISVIAGETVPVKVTFTANTDVSDVRIRAELEGDKVDVFAITGPFDVITGNTYSKTLNLKIPSELEDVKNDTIILNFKIWNGGDKTEIEAIALTVQRPSYNADVKSVSVSNSVDAGETFPVDIVLRNTGYNDLDDVYVTAKISALGVEKTGYFGDLVAVDTDNDDDTSETAHGVLSIKVPYNAASGVYELEIVVSNEDGVSKVVKEITVTNGFSDSVIVTSEQKTVATGESAEYSLLLVNPTDKLKVYKIVSESSADVSTDVQESVVAIPAGSSKTVKVTASALTEGKYNFSLNVLSGDAVVETVTLGLNAEGKSSATTNPVVVLTVILAIIFVVLLIVLVILLGKKPEKSDDAESYY